MTVPRPTRSAQRTRYSIVSACLRVPSPGWATSRIAYVPRDESLARWAASGEPERVPAGEELAASRQQPDACSATPELDLEQLYGPDLWIGRRRHRPRDERERGRGCVGEPSTGRLEREPRDEVDVVGNGDRPRNVHLGRVRDAEDELAGGGTRLRREIGSVGPNDDLGASARSDADLLRIDGDLDTLRGDRSRSDRYRDPSRGGVRDAEDALGSRRSDRDSERDERRLGEHLLLDRRAEIDDACAGGGGVEIGALGGSHEQAV